MYATPKENISVEDQRILRAGRYELATPHKLSKLMGEPRKVGKAIKTI